MKVLHLLSSQIYSGAEKTICDIIEVSSEDGALSVYCSPESSAKAVLEKKGIPYFPLKKMSLAEVRRAVKAERPDIVHAHDLRASVLAALSYHGKIISHLHKNDPRMSKPGKISILYNIVSKKFEKVVGCSDAVCSEYRFKKNIEDKFVTVSNYVDPEKVLSSALEYPVDKDYDLVFIGRLCDEKNPLEFIEIVRSLRDKCPEIQAVMIGDGVLRDACLSLIEKYDLSENITLTGFLSNPFPYVKKSRVCIVPSKFEGFGISAVECMALGKVVLSGGVGGLREIFREHTEFFCSDTREYCEKYLAYRDVLPDYSAALCRYCDRNAFSNKIRSLYL